MNTELFELDRFNVLQDDEYYYVFRALNRADHKDFIDYLLEFNNDAPRIRTDRERFEEVHGKAKYAHDSEISLEEVYDHIKMHYLKETNCISLSTNANVSLDYGSNYFDEYAVIKIPKKEINSNIVHAGNYMMFEIFIKIEEALQENEVPENVTRLINFIDNCTSSKDIEQVISDLVRSVNYERNVLSRFQDRQYFDNEQQLEYNKLIAKATVLEVIGLLPSVIKTNRDNSSLLSTVGNAFSSGEIIHYKDIPRKDFSIVSKRMMNLFALIQQLKEKMPNYKDVLLLEKKVLYLLNNGFDIKEKAGEIVIANDEKVITCGIKADDSLIFNPTIIDANLLSVDEIYNITGGTISYTKARKAVEFCYNLALSRKETYDYATIISVIMGNSSLTEDIMEKAFVVNPKIIDRGNHNGYKLCESVNIGLDNEGNNFYSLNDQVNLINLVLRLQLDKIELLINNQGVVFRNSILSSLPKGEVVSRAEYYANAIIDSIDFSKIYDESINEAKIKANKLKMSTALAGSNIGRLYLAFKNTDLSHEEISYYIFNLFIEKKFKGYTFDEICNLENIEEFISSNFTVFNKNINELTLNNYLGIFTDVNYVPNSHISLRDFQQRIKNETDRIYQNDRRFAGVVLPTGGGKSFIAMAEMMERQHEKIVYIAPRVGILRNFKKNIVEYVAGLDSDGLSDRELDIIVKDCFPHFETICYQSLDSKDEERLADFNADFIILDEIHHIGGASWNPLIKKLLDSNPNSKVLGISATPQRDDYKEFEGEQYFDMYGGDMMMAMAAYLDNYTPAELMQKRYLACDINIIDAIQDGYVICPNIVSFDYSLDQTDEYQKTISLAYKIRDQHARKIAQDEIEKMLTVIGDAKLNGVDEIIGEHLKVKDGKYILFVPRKPLDYNGTTDEYIEKFIDDFRSIIYEIDNDPHIEYIHSDRGEKVNSEVMRRFEVDNGSHMKILVAIDMLNEGIHLSRINGSFNFRKIDKKHLILSLQHLGRVIYAIDPSREYTDSDIPIVFDKFNNYSNLDMDRLVNKKTVTSDLQKLKDAIFWIEKYGRYPSAESKSIPEKRKAVTLMRIKEKYFKFIDANLDEYGLNDYDKANALEIIELCNKFNIWDTDFGTISRREKRKIERVELFNVSAVKETFIEVCNKVKEIVGVDSLKLSDRLELLLKVLDILSENNIILSPNTIQEEMFLSAILEGVNGDIVEEILFELGRLGLGSNYPLGREFYLGRISFYNNRSIFGLYDYNLEDITLLRKYGILCNGPDYELINDRGFIYSGPNRLLRKNIWTGTYFSKDNYNIEGYDPYNFDVNTGIHKLTGTEYNPYGFNIHHIHVYTGTKYDSHGFDINHYHKLTSSLYDKRGFDVDGNWHRYDSITNEYKVSYSKYDEDGYDIDGYDDRGFNKYGIHKVTQKPYDELFFDIDDNYWKLGDDGNRYNTNRKYNDRMFDRKGFLYEVDKTTGKITIKGQVYNDYGFYGNGLHYITQSIVDPNGYDIDGIWYRKDPTGKYVSTGSIFNDKGWTRDGKTLRHNVYGAPFDEDGNLFLDDVDDYGFDSRGRYHYPVDPVDRNGFMQYHDGVIKYSGRIMFKNSVNGEFYDIHHFNRAGICSLTGTHLNPNNFDRNGYWWKEDENGELVCTYNYFDDDGWTIDGRILRYQGDDLVYSETNERGFNFRKLYKPGHFAKVQKYDSHGFDYYGINYVTGTHLDENNFDINGYWWREDESGQLVATDSLYNDEGWSRNHTYINTGTIRDEHGFDYLHLYRYSATSKFREGRLSEYDPHGFNYLGIHRKTGKVYNHNHFDIDGYWYKKVGNEYVKTDSKYDEEGFDINRRDVNDFTKNGYYGRTKKKYNERGFMVNGVHLRTNQPYDLAGLDMSGEPYPNVDWNLIKRIKEEDLFSQRIYIEEIIDEIKENYLYDDYQAIMEMYDPLIDEFDDYFGEVDAFVKVVLQRAIKKDETLYSEREVIEYMKADARSRLRKKHLSERKSYYYDTEVKKMVVDGDLSQLDIDDIFGEGTYRLF